MRLSRYVQRTRVLGGAEVPAHTIDAVGDAIVAGHDLAELLKNRDRQFQALSPRSILAIWRAHHALDNQKSYLAESARQRRADGKAPIPSALIGQAVAPHEVSVLERAEAMAPEAGSVAEHRRRDSIKEALVVWNACLAIARRDGVLDAALATDDPEQQEEFGGLAGKELIKDISPHRWLAIRRGEDAEALYLSLELVEEPLLNQIHAHGPGLSPLAKGRTADGLLDELVLSELANAVLVLKDHEAAQAAIESGSEAYLGLLSTPRPKFNMVAAVWVPPAGGKLSVAIVQRDGRLLDSATVAPRDNPVAAVEKAMKHRTVEGIVLAASAEDPDTLKTLANGFGELPVLRVKPAAMKAAAKLITEGITPAVGKALTLGRRAVRPLKYWAQIDPVALGLVEYQQDLNVSAVRTALLEMQVLAAAGIKPGDLTRPVDSAAVQRPTTVPRAPAAPLNPLVKNVHDLRPGMTLNGVITNIAGFGAFVNVGLSHEGLIHVSELAEHFVKDPNDVVRVGQQITARVLGVDPSRGRISLSLKPDRTAPQPQQREGDPRKGVPLDDLGRFGHGRGGGGKGRPKKTGTSRSQALADLEALFKKGST